MNHSLAIHLQPYVVQVVNSFISPFISSTVIVLFAAVIFVPSAKAQSGFWSWHPVKRLLAVIFLTPFVPLCFFIWPFLLLAWLLRPRCHCQSCQDDD
jgi:hypothetical protein